MRTAEEFTAEANAIRERIEAEVAREGDLRAYFEGQVCGEDGAGRWIVGFGVYGGGGHITLDPCRVSVCGHESAPFSAGTERALRELFAEVENA